MKTVMLINSSGSRFFRRDKGAWRLIERPAHNDKLWVIANLPEESLETFKLPLLFGRDRSNFLERRLAAAFPHSLYRAAPLISGGLLKSGTAALTGLTTTDALTSQFDKLDTTIAGVWGISLLLTLMLKRSNITNVVLALPSVHHLRIQVLKDGLPVLTRCVRRYSEDTDLEHDSDANEILRTSQHLENHRIFEHGAIPAVLYLGENTSVGEHLAPAGLRLLPVPAAFSPVGEAGFLHPLFEMVTSSPRGQLAPLQLRAQHLGENIRMACYTGIAVSLLGVMLFGQSDFRALLALHQRENTLQNDLQIATAEYNRLNENISMTGKDPALVRQATRFASLELERVPTPKSIFQLLAGSIADLPQVRIRNLTFRLPKQGDSYCQGRSSIEQPLLKNMFMMNDSAPAGTSDPDSVPPRHAELKFSILLTDNLTPAAQAEISRRISVALKKVEGLQLMDDPAAFSLINTLKGGLGMDTAQTENTWCMSIPWKNKPDISTHPDSLADTPSSPSSGRSSERESPSRIPAGVGASLPKQSVKGLP